MKRRKNESDEAWKEWLQNRAQLRDDRLLAFKQRLENQETILTDANLRGPLNVTSKSQKQIEIKSRRSRRLRRVSKKQYQESSPDDDGEGEVGEETLSEDTEENEMDSFKKEEMNRIMKNWVEDEEEDEDNHFGHSTHEYYVTKNTTPATILDYVEDAEDDLYSASELEDSEEALLEIDDEELADL
ncbi:hypothetical protein CORC01_11046 [Colletotrichum orchidophilum]|uniref:Uncharacterized protein n=1 Tax=Colletotrichum orchidophilum TaxID=1209926 RepID=A0A1G4AX27_9PEZI|nr:uncharacterized protein CORC01_11046 [Colletotrichum orchidophilum]OHE93643.1 hypothetical protein CORC01_11046 [Colletotrichum orchidophilum]